MIMPKTFACYTDRIRKQFSFCVIIQGRLPGWSNNQFL